MSMDHNNTANNTKTTKAPPPPLTIPAPNSVTTSHSSEEERRRVCYENWGVIPRSNTQREQSAVQPQNQGYYVIRYDKQQPITFTPPAPHFSTAQDWRTRQPTRSRTPEPPTSNRESQKFRNTNIGRRGEITPASTPKESNIGLI